MGASSALELSRRGHQVTLICGSKGRSPFRASRDDQKAVRQDYGRDRILTDLAAYCIELWPLYAGQHFFNCGVRLWRLLKIM